MLINPRRKRVQIYLLFYFAHLLIFVRVKCAKIKGTKVLHNLKYFFYEKKSLIVFWSTRSHRLKNISVSSFRVLGLTLYLSNYQTHIRRPSEKRDAFMRSQNISSKKVFQKRTFHLIKKLFGDFSFLRSVSPRETFL